MGKLAQACRWCLTMIVGAAVNLTVAVCVLVLSVLAGVLVGILCLCASVMVVVAVLAGGAMASVVVVGLGAAGLGDCLADGWRETVREVKEETP